MTRARMLLRNAPWPNTELLRLLPRFTCLVFIAFVSSCDICNFMSQRRISKHNSYCEILLMNQADSVKVPPPTRQTTFKNDLHTHRDRSSLGRKKPPTHPRHRAPPSDASSAFNRFHGARCSTTGQDAPQVCPLAAIRHSTAPPKKWWVLRWQGKLPPGIRT